MAKTHLYLLLFPLVLAAFGPPPSSLTRRVQALMRFGLYTAGHYFLSPTSLLSHSVDSFCFNSPCCIRNYPVCVWVKIRLTLTVWVAPWPGPAAHVGENPWSTVSSIKFCQPALTPILFNPFNDTLIPLNGIFIFHLVHWPSFYSVQV